MGCRSADLIDGRLPVYLLLAGIVAAVVTEVKVLRTMGRRDYLFKGISITTLLSWLRGAGWLGCGGSKLDASTSAPGAPSTSQCGGRALGESLQSA
jgi:hypothetical protein